MRTPIPAPAEAARRNLVPMSDSSPAPGVPVSDEHTPEVLVHEDGHLTVITIDRDHKRNALSAEVCRAIADAVAAAPGRDDVRVIMIRGAGRAFCAGADLGGGAHGSSDFHVQLARMLRAIQECPAVVIADIQGPAVGAGTQLAMACDLRVVGERGWFQVPPVKLGIAVDAWTIRRARVLLGGSRARTVLLGAERMDRDEAAACGFASYCGDSALADEVAGRLAGYAPLSLEYHKMVLNDDETHIEPRPEQLELYRRVWASEDAVEAGRARAEKRDPVFRGR